MDSKVKYNKSFMDFINEQSKNSCSNRQKIKIKEMQNQYKLLGKSFDIQSLISTMSSNLFPFSEYDLIDINNEQTFSCNYAFNIPIPPMLIKEAIISAKNSDTNLSRLVLKYPYIQLIVAYWIITKMYSIYLVDPNRIGALTNNKSYNSFNEYLSYNYLPFKEYAVNPDRISNDSFKATFESMAKIILKSDDKEFISTGYGSEPEYEYFNKKMTKDHKNLNVVLKYQEEQDFSLYDLIYDLFYHGVCKTFRETFQNGRIQEYLPLNNLLNNIYKYKEIEFQELYGSNEEKSIYPNINRKITRLEFLNPSLLAEDSLIVKNNPNQFMHGENNYAYNPKLGPIYDELWEISSRPIEHEKANNNGDKNLYLKWFYDDTTFPPPPYRINSQREYNEKGEIINDGMYYTYEEMEEITGQKFYFSHNFHVLTPLFYKRRMFLGFEWNRAKPLTDIEEAFLNNELYSSLYYKYAGLQLITSLFINLYGKY